MATAPLERPRVAKAAALNCTGCGAALEVRSFSHVVSIVCPNCKAVLDATDPKLKILQEAQKKNAVTPIIPLGSRGVMRGTRWEVIGFQLRAVTVDGIPYAWHEYLLFNPYAGFRYLTYYNGHWSWVKVLHTLPEPSSAGGRPAVVFEGQTFKHFQTAPADTLYVLGEFSWRVRTGDKVAASDYVSPPLMLSAEETEEEITWSLGEYTDPAEIWTAFKLPGTTYPKIGVFANQPNPHKERSGPVWRTAGLLLVALVVLAIWVFASAQAQTAYQMAYNFTPGISTDASVVTDVFELKGHTSNVEIDTTTDLNNNWAYFNYALINYDTGQAYDFGREVSFYHGSDSDGPWSEGGMRDEATIGSVPPGHYYLRIEPEMDKGARAMSYSVVVKRDVPSFGWFVLAGLAILIPPVLSGWRSYAFEYSRWQESDYAVESSSGDDDE